MNTQDLADTARGLVAGDKGLLAMDESNGTCNKRFAQQGIPRPRRPARLSRTDREAMKRMLRSRAGSQRERIRTLLSSESVSIIRSTTPLALGNGKLMTELGITFGDLVHKADELRNDGAPALFVAIDQKLGGVIAIADPIISTTHAARRSPC